MSAVYIVALVFLLVSFVLAAINRELSALNFAVWAIAIVAILPHISLR